MQPIEAHTRRVAPGDGYFDRHAESRKRTAKSELATLGHILDAQEARDELRKLLEWFYYEKEKQAANRLEMAIDCDFYDNIQWDPADKADLQERGQMPLVYNEVAPMCDWLIGTERRTRVDWTVLPRTEDDVQLADVKRKVLKYTADVNRVQFNRSRAFADAIKAGVGWVDSGARDDPTKDILYHRYEDWRNVLWDSCSYDLDLEDCRYLFRWRWVDEDIACAMFPDRADKIRQAVNDSSHHSFGEWDNEDTWMTAADMTASSSGTIRAGGSAMMVDAQRRRVRLIEAQYRKPTQVKIVASGPMKGAFFDPSDMGLISALNKHGGSIIDKVVMRMHVAVFTEAAMLTMGPSIYRHNSFSLTPIWCYRRGRDRLPYGVIRRVRDIQQDLNKRASKALWLLNTNQVIADHDATEDWDTLREEADHPNGTIVKKRGSEVIIRRDTDAATGQIQMMSMDAQAIQKSAGVSQENMGRQTNAVSGEAIRARQLQGSVVTTEPYDNLRLATQLDGAKQLSLAEQFYSEEKVIRLTGANQQGLEWIKVNVPELQADGSVRFLNDMTASMADFIVTEADYSGTLRQVMFESLNNMASRLPPEVAMRMLTIAMTFSDLPNKDDIANELRKLTGERDPNKPMTPEEAAQAEQQMAAQAEALQIQRQQAMQALEEQAAKIRETNARAAKLEAEAQSVLGGGDGAGVDMAVAQVRREASLEIDRLSDALRKAQSDLANRTLQIRSDADAKVEAARIQADANIRIAEIQKISDNHIDALNRRLAMLEDAVSARRQSNEVQV